MNATMPGSVTSTQRGSGTPRATATQPGPAPTAVPHRPARRAASGSRPPAVDVHGDHAAGAVRDAGTCDLVTVPARQGLEAVDILRRVGARAVGPVLHDGPCATLGFLVPPGTADAWDLPGSACTQTPGHDRSPVSAPLVAGTGWLLPPGDTGHVTDPAVLRAALGEAARLIEAADSCR